MITDILPVARKGKGKGKGRGKGVSEWAIDSGKGRANDYLEKKDKEPEEIAEGGASVAVDRHLFMGYDITMLRGKIHGALLGYMRINLINPPEGAHWGQFNDRAIREDWIRDLSNDYRDTFVDNCSDRRAIDIAVKTGWLAMDAKKIPSTPNGKKIGEMPMLEFNKVGAEEVKPKNLWMLGGNHRRVALTGHLDKIRSEIKELKEILAAQQAVQVSGGFKGTLDVEGNKILERIGLLEEKVEREEQWVVRLFDRGAHERARLRERERADDEDAAKIEDENDKDTADAIFRLMSRNETKSMHKSTDEEQLLELLEELNKAYRTDLEKLKAFKENDEGEDNKAQDDSQIQYPEFMKAIAEKADMYKQEHAGFRKLTCMPSFVLSLVMASRVARHYTHAPWFKVATFNKMVEVHGCVREQTCTIY